MRTKHELERIRCEAEREVKEALERLQESGASIPDVLLGETWRTGPVVHFRFDYRDQGAPYGTSERRICPLEGWLWGSDSLDEKGWETLTRRLLNEAEALAAA